MKRLLLLLMIACFTLTALCGCSLAESLIDMAHSDDPQPTQALAAEPAEPVEEPVTEPEQEPEEDISALTCTWMGYDIMLTGFEAVDAKTVFGPMSTVTPDGQFVQITFACVDCEIPTDVIEGNLDACVWLEDVNDTLGVLDSPVVSRSFNGVAFDPETGEFSVLDTHTQFGVVLDTSADIAIEDFIVCLCACSGESDVVKMPVSLIPPEETAE